MNPKMKVIFCVFLAVSSASNVAYTPTESKYLELVNPNIESSYSRLAVPGVPTYEEYDQEDRIIPHEMIHVDGVPLSRPFNILVNDFDETLLYATYSGTSTDSIVSFDTRTKVFKDLSGKISGSAGSDRTTHTQPKISSDGKLIAFVKRDESVFSDQGAYIYLMNSDGSNLRRLVPCHPYEALDFGPDSKSILYVDPNGNLNKINHDFSIEEIENHFRGEDKYQGICKISHVHWYVYWQTNLLGGFKIWRKNLLTESAVPELVYKSGGVGHVRNMHSYIVSPDGKKLFVSEANDLGEHFMGIFVIGSSNNNKRNSHQTPLINQQSSLRYFDWLAHMFWYTDAQGQNWIYAEILDGTSKGLVRFRVDALPRFQYEMVIPDFASYSGVSIVPKRRV